MVRTGGGRPRSPDGERPAKRSRGAKPSSGPGDGELEELDISMLDRMADYLERHGGSMDYGRFAAEFPGTKKRQIESHFELVNVDGTSGGRWEIRLGDGAGGGGGGGGGGQARGREEARGCSGHIIFFDKSKGYGFINSAARQGEDIFFPRGALPRNLQDIRQEDLKGMEVAFDLYMKDDGKPRAEKLQALRGGPGRGDRDAGGPMPPPPPPGGSSSSGARPGTMLGRIARFDTKKGYGFIHCAELGEDIFFLPSLLPKELDNRSDQDIIGEEVEVEVGPPEAVGKKPRALRMELARRRGRPSSGGGASSRPSSAGGAPPPPPHLRDGTILVGTIISFDTNKGFGFVRPDEVDQDVFYLRQEMPSQIRDADRREQVVDARVEFEVKNMPDGKLRALRMTMLGRGMPPGPPPPGWMPPGAFGRMPPMGPPGPPLPSAPPIGPVGVVRKFDPKKGYGFITLQGGGEDVFFLPSALPKDMRDSLDRLEGMEVSVDFFVNEEGKPRAKEVRPAPPMRPPGGYGGPPGPYGMPPMGPPMPPMGPMGAMMQGMAMAAAAAMGGHPPPPMPPMPSGDQLYTGEFVRFEMAKGFGFIAPDGLPEDVFCLRSEMPPELRDATSKDKVIGKRVEFQVKSMPDGKLRARAVELIRPPKGGGGGRRAFGRILRYDAAKGYGFIKCPEVNGNVFFLRSSLPKNLADKPPEELKDIDVSFDLAFNEEGKPRASHLETEDGPPPESRRGGGSGGGAGPQHGEVMAGNIVRYDHVKAYGFVKPDRLDEDVFFLRVELPPSLKAAADEPGKNQIDRKRVEFEICVMPDGKLRAQRMTCLDEDDQRIEEDDFEVDNGSAEGDAGEMPPLEDHVIVEMEEFLEQKGGGCDYGKFATHFPKVKKSQVQQHFEITGGNGRGAQRIELPDGHPLKPAAPPAYDEPKDEGNSADADQEMADNEVPDEEPAMPAGSPGLQPQGRIRQYDPVKGFGFIRCDGLEEDIFFPRSSLPDTFQAKQRGEMPELVGVHVSFDLNPESDRGPRAEKINLLLKWHAEDRCWLLKRK